MSLGLLTGSTLHEQPVSFVLPKFSGSLSDGFWLPWLCLRIRLTTMRCHKETARCCRISAAWYHDLNVLWRILAVWGLIGKMFFKAVDNRLFCCQQMKLAAQLSIEILKQLISSFIDLTTVTLF